MADAEGEPNENLEKADDLDQLYEELYVNDISFGSQDGRDSFLDDNSNDPWLEGRDDEEECFDDDALGEDSEYERWRLEDREDELLQEEQALDTSRELARFAQTTNKANDNLDYNLEDRVTGDSNNLELAPNK